MFVSMAVYDTDLYDQQAVNDRGNAMHQQTRVRRDVFEETKFVELFIVADNTEVGTGVHDGNLHIGGLHFTQLLMRTNMLSQEMLPSV